MVFRTVGAIATALIGVSGQALAQYYPPHQAYPRQPLPPAVNADELPSLNAPAVRPLAAPATNHETVGRLQRTLTACVAPFRPARPVRPDRMQYGRRPYGRS